MTSNGMFFFIFPGDPKAHYADKKTIEQVWDMPDLDEHQVSQAVSLEGMTQEEREAKVLELTKTREKIRTESSAQPVPIVEGQ